MLFTCSLYLETRRRLRCESSFTAVAQACLGPKASLLINFLLTFCIFGVMNLYMILFSRVVIALFGDPTNPSSILNYKPFYLVLLCIIQLPIVLKKNIHELKIASYMLFVGVFSLLTLLCVNLYLFGSHETRGTGVVHPTRPAVTTENIVDSLNITVASFGFLLVLFPVRNSMKSTVRHQIGFSLMIALISVFSMYLLLSILSIVYFGRERVQPSLFDNFSSASDWFSITVMYLFMFIFLCNIPFVFFGGKIALISLIEQIQRMRSNTVTDQDLYIRTLETDSEAESESD